MKKLIIKWFTHFISDKNKRKQVRNILLYNGVSSESTILKNSVSIIKKLEGIDAILRLNINPACLPAAVGDLRLQQRASLALLIKIERFLKKNKLVYWLDFGTLLGAVRHKGFIPWDDDIDIAMPRKDYEKLKKICNQFCGNGISFSEGDIIRIFYKNTSAQVDIFPYDSGNSTKLPNDEEYNSIIKTIDRLYHSIPFQIETYRKSIIPESYKAKIGGITKDEILKGKNSPRNAYMFLAYHCFAWKRVLCDYSEIFPLKKINFEGFEFSSPNNAFLHLHNYYGDFEALPNNCVSHHNGMINSIKNSNNLQDMIDLINGELK